MEPDLSRSLIAHQRWARTQHAKLAQHSLLPSSKDRSELEEQRPGGGEQAPERRLRREGVRLRGAHQHGELPVRGPEAALLDAEQEPDPRSGAPLYADG